MKQHKPINSKELAKKLVIVNWRKKAEEEMAKKRARKVIKLFSTVTCVLLCSACSVADPAVSGYMAGGMGHEINVPESGTLRVTHEVTRLPEGKIGADGGRMYNQSIYDRFTDWLVKPVGGK